MGPSPYIDPRLSEKELTGDEYLLREAFVQEYMKTRNAYKACIALGFMEAYAQDWAKALMGEGIVRRLISKSEREEDSAEGSIERQRKYRAWMETEATYYGPGSSHGSRVSAISHLMRMEGMEAPTKAETEVIHKGGVMMVPALTNPDEWGSLATKSQAELKANVKD
jgi:phage terminase small subunit